MSHTLILLRHGQSTWNEKNLFTGWTDVGLTDKGREEAASAGRLIRESGYQPDVLHTSVLARAIQTADIALEAAGWGDLETKRDWRLNERPLRGASGPQQKANVGGWRGRASSGVGDGPTTSGHLAWTSTTRGTPPTIPATTHWMILQEPSVSPTS